LGVERRGVRARGDETVVKRGVGFGDMCDERLVDRYHPLDCIKLLKCEAHSELKLMRHTKYPFFPRGGSVPRPKAPRHANQDPPRRNVAISKVWVQALMRLHKSRMIAALSFVEVCIKQDSPSSPCDASFTHY